MSYTYILDLRTLDSAAVGSRPKWPKLLDSAETVQQRSESVSSRFSDGRDAALLFVLALASAASDAVEAIVTDMRQILGALINKGATRGLEQYNRDLESNALRALGNSGNGARAFWATTHARWLVEEFRGLRWSIPMLR